MIGNIIKIVALCVLLAVASTAAASFSYESGNCRSASGCYVISGTITDLDVAAVRSMVNKVMKNHPVARRPYVTLNSTGGNVASALKIGRMLRKVRAIALMSAQDVCYSSCVFLLAGSTQRLIGGDVAIHRPYTLRTGVIDLSKAEQRYRHTAKKIEQYLNDMNVSLALYNSMIRVPPEKIRHLSKAELTSYGLNQTDPVEQEFFDSLGADQYGITKREYLRRKNEAEANCRQWLSINQVDEYMKCKKFVMKNGN